MRLTIGSLFSGIGGLELGLERAGLGPVLWQTEIEPYCRAVLAKHWPDARRYEDVRLVRGSTLAPVDIICGGFPCQGISIAGKGLGMSDPRSGLWREYARVVGEVLPRYVVVENSSYLAGRGLDAVLADLSALGYDAQWFPVSVPDVGGPHLRERLFVVAHAHDEGQPTLSVDDGARSGVSSDARAPDADPSGVRLGRRRFPEPSGTVGEPSGHRVLLRAALPDPDDTGVEEHGISVSAQPEQPTAEREGWRSTEPEMVRVVHGLPRGMDRRRVHALGNAVVPQVAQVVGWVVRGIAKRLEELCAR